VSILNDRLAREAKIQLLHFGEPVLYRPASHGEEDEDLSIMAIVDRSPGVFKTRRNVSSLIYPIEALIAVEDVAQVVAGADQIKLPTRIGLDPEWMPVAAMLAQDHGFWELGIRR